MGDGVMVAAHDFCSFLKQSPYLINNTNTVTTTSLLFAHQHKPSPRSHYPPLFPYIHAQGSIRFPKSFLPPCRCLVLLAGRAAGTISTLTTRENLQNGPVRR
jgi:hypothetical protein